MFDVGFWEMALIMVLALLILGPERLPRAARSVGLLIGRARAAWYSVRSEMDREFQLQEMQKMARSLEEEVEQVRKSGREFEAELNRAVEGAAKGRSPEEEVRSPAPEGGDEPAPAAEAAEPPTGADDKRSAS